MARLHDQRRGSIRLDDIVAEAQPGNAGQDCVARACNLDSRIAASATTPARFSGTVSRSARMIADSAQGLSVGTGVTLMPAAPMMQSMKARSDARTRLRPETRENPATAYSGSREKSWLALAVQKALQKQNDRLSG